MRKIILSFVLVLCTFFMAFAQSADKNGSLEENSYVSGKQMGLKSGYKGFVDVSYAFGVGHINLDRAEFSTIHGYQFNPYLYLGLGIGVNYYQHNADGVVPIFANVKGTFLKGNITPFVDMRLGYSVGDVEGVYVNPSFGCRLGVGKRFGINISLGYTLQKSEPYEEYIQTDYKSNSLNLGGVNFRIGFDF